MKKLIILLMPFLFLLSCNDDDELAVDDLTSGPKVVGFAQSTYNFAYFEDEGAVDVTLPVKLIGLGNGLLPSNDIVVNYQIVEDQTTATLGQEYEFDSQSTTIPAGNTFGEINLTINTGSMNPSEPTQLVLLLTSTSDGVVSHNNKYVYIQFVGCETDLEGDYIGNVNGEPQTETEITKVAPNVYRAILPGVSAGGQALWVEFSDVCGTLKMTDWQYQGGYAIVDPNTGDFPVGYIDGTTLVFEHVTLTGLDFYQDNQITYELQ